MEEVVHSDQTARGWLPEPKNHVVKFLYDNCLTQYRLLDCDPDKNKLRKEGCIFSHGFRWFKSVMTGKAWWSAGHSVGECGQSYSRHGRLESIEEG